jgi:hypothetical protein
MVNPPAGWSTIGDAQGVVLFDGTFMQANCCTTQAALLNPTTLTWTATGSGKFDVNDEDGWTLLPTRKVLTVDAYFFSTTATALTRKFTTLWRARGPPPAVHGPTLGLC